MTEISDREYALLMDAMRSTTTASQSLQSSVSALQLDLERRFLTKAEDVAADDERIKSVYDHVDDVAKGLGGRLTILQWVIAGQGALILALAGWYVASRG